MPEEAPVTITTLSLKRFFIHLFLDRYRIGDANLNELNIKKKKSIFCVRN
jgi:hypothetical protein